MYNKEKRVSGNPVKTRCIASLQVPGNPSGLHRSVDNASHTSTHPGRDASANGMRRGLRHGLSTERSILDGMQRCIVACFSTERGIPRAGCNDLHVIYFVSLNKEKRVSGNSVETHAMRLYEKQGRT
jgi:hypothetical protein